MTASSPATEGMEDGQHGDEDTITVGGREGGGVAREGDGGGDLVMELVYLGWISDLGDIRPVWVKFWPRVAEISPVARLNQPPEFSRSRRLTRVHLCRHFICVHTSNLRRHISCP